MKYITLINEEKFEVEVGRDGSITVNGEPVKVEMEPLPDGRASSMIVNSESFEAVVVPESAEIFEVLIDGERHQVQVQDELAFMVSQARETAAAALGEVTVKSPMPGLILNVPAIVGASVEKGEKLVILESMKMENELKSPRAGVVKSVQVEAGASVEKGQVLVVIGDADEE